VLAASHQSARHPFSPPGSRLTVMETGVSGVTVIGPSCPLAFMFGVGKVDAPSTSSASKEKKITTTIKHILISIFLFMKVSFSTQK
jgi:hypothetical protein